MKNGVRKGLGLGCALYGVVDLPSVLWRLDAMRPEWATLLMFSGYVFILVVVYGAALVAFVRGQRPLLTAGVLYLCLTQFTTWGVATTGSLSVTPSLIGPMLLTWIACHTWGRFRRHSDPECEALSVDAMCGVFAAMMVIAAVSKFQASGLDWANGETHAMLIFERHLTAPGPLRWFRNLLAQSPSLCAVGAGSVWLIEALAPLFIWKPLRPIYAWLVLMMFTGLALTLGILEPAWIVMPLALAYPGKR